MDCTRWRFSIPTTIGSTSSDTRWSTNSRKIEGGGDQTQRERVSLTADFTGDKLTKLTGNPPAWKTILRKACSTADFSPFCRAAMMSICCPLSKLWSLALEVALGALGVRSWRFRLTWDLAKSMRRSSSLASSGQEGHPDTPADRLFPSKWALMRIALPWNSFPQCAHLTSVAMPWRSGSFTTRTCPHSTPFTFTIAKGLVMGCLSYNTSTSSTLPKRAQKTLQILVVPDATSALPLLCEPQTLALGSWEHTSPCYLPLGSRPPSPLPNQGRSLIPIRRRARPVLALTRKESHSRRRPVVGW